MQAPPESLDPASFGPFRRRVLSRGSELYRDLPWRRTRDPYAVLVSEVMLQQTQVARVDGRWQRWLSRFPSVDALASADAADVLEEWQGLGYNRRALALWNAARAMSALGGSVPSGQDALVRLPGIGPATAAGVRAFAFDLPGTYLETNVRAVFLHELFAGMVDVPDREVARCVAATCPQDAHDPADDPRTWYYALLDYGAHLKRTVPSPSRRSKAHVRQSRFEGSHRQKRAEAVRILLAAGAGGIGLGEAAEALSSAETGTGRDPLSPEDVRAILDELAAEGFCSAEDGRWRL